jgi:GNAT superfamily N-acetyltransferase
MEKKWTIRKAKRSDAQGIFLVIFVGWLDSYVNEAIGVTREFILSKKLFQLEYGFYRDKLKYEFLDNSEDNIHYVAEDSNGVILGHLHANRDGENGQVLQGLYVYKELHGTGLAQELAKRFDEWEDKGQDSSVHVVEYNARAIRFYEKLGFVDTNKRDVVSEKIPCAYMVKKNVKEEK